ncbi:MAG: haloacid dehalogenase-like hydrolase [Acidobacteria bacterium]|nr:haloacid dehalogenase-like hydrolase [Acidobacteriota bacterium]
MKLVLFDIDGTLIRDNGAARDAFADALREIYGHEPELKRFDFSGRTDPEITWMVLEQSGLSENEVEEGLERLWVHYLNGLKERIDRSSVRLMPGVETLLEALSAREDVVLALLTGNIEPGARTKLSPFGLNRFFPFGAFGSDSRFRNELPPVALSRAREHGHDCFSSEDLVVIGDSVYDIRCAVPHRARSVAVATGVTPSDILQAESPDHFFETLEDTERVVEVICA